MMPEHKRLMGKAFETMFLAVLAITLHKQPQW